MPISKPVVGIVAKPKQERAIELAAKVVDWVELQGLDYRVGEEVAAELPAEGMLGKKTLARSEITTCCDPIVVLGGDGTLISVARYPAAKPPTIIGVNVGTLGFLTEITADELFPTLEAVLEERAQIELRPILEAHVERASKQQSEFFAVNDVVITKEALARIFAVELTIDSQFAAILKGDGVIVATPGGSTAYSLASGGSIVHPQVEGLLITPICPHSLTSRPLVVPGNSEICLTIPNGSVEGLDKVYLTIDGQEGMVLLGGDVVRVTTSSHKVCFAKSASRNYFQVLATKLNWAVPNIRS